MNLSIVIIIATLIAYYFIVVWLKKLEFMAYIPDGFTKWLLLVIMATLLDIGLGWALSEIKDSLSPTPKVQHTISTKLISKAVQCRSNPNLAGCAKIKQQAEQALARDLGGLS